LGDPVVDPHEVGVFGEHGYDLARADPLSLTCYRGDRHKALLRSGAVGDFIQSLIEVLNGESLSETSTVFVPPPIAVTLGILVVSGLISGCVGGQLVFLDVIVVSVGSGL
jgi:hypothetical protein